MRIIFFALLLLSTFVASAQQRDTLLMNNGFTAYGTLKALENGRVQLETDLFGTVNADVNHIAAIVSDTYFEVTTTDGLRMLARFARADSLGYARLIADKHVGKESQDAVVAIANLYAVTVVSDEFRTRLSVALQGGLSYTKANETFQVNWGLDAAYSSYINRHSLTYDGLYTENPELVARRQNLVYNYNRNFSARQFLYAAGEIQSNTQLQLAFRGQAALGGGQNFFQNREKQLAVVLAVNSNNEVPLEGDGFSSVEGLIGYRFRHSNLLDGKMSINSNLSYFRTITSTNRRRVDFDTRISWKVYGNFSLAATYFINFDSRSVQTKERLVDYTILLSVNYRL